MASQVHISLGQEDTFYFPLPWNNLESAWTQMIVMESFSLYNPTFNYNYWERESGCLIP